MNTVSTPASLTTPCRCRTCDRTATRGTPAAETSADPTLCPRCEHYRVMELAGLAGDYQGADSAVFAEPAPDDRPRVGGVAVTRPATLLPAPLEALDQDVLDAWCDDLLDAARAAVDAEATPEQFRDDDALNPWTVARAECLRPAVVPSVRP